MEQNKLTADDAEKTSSFSIGNFLNACMLKWKWFAISILLCTGLGVLYTLRQQPIYMRTMSVLIKDQHGNGGAAEVASAFSSFGLVATNTNVYNELISILSPDVMSDVVQELDLTMNYVDIKFPHGITLYGTNLPFKVSLPDIESQQGAAFRIEVNPDGSKRLYKFRRSVGKGVEKFKEEVRIGAGVTVAKTPIGRVEITPNPEYTGVPNDETTTIGISKSGLQPAIEYYNGQLKGELADKDADVINLSITDVSIQRAVDILNTVLKVYNNKYINDKNKVAQATTKFINDRLGVIVNELGNIDQDISRYKSTNKIPDAEYIAKINIEKSSRIDQDILEAGNQLGLMQYVSDYVKNPANRYSVIPLNAVSDNASLAGLVEKYNTDLLARNQLEQSTSRTNPLVVDYDHQLDGERKAIEGSIDNQVKLYASRLSSLQASKGGIGKELSETPQLENHLASYYRQQQVKEQLYLYMLQKLNETELSQSFTADNTRIITPPMGSLNPIAPKKSVIVLVAFMLGLIFPAAIIYVRESSNTKVRSRKDLERMSTPFVGEIPFVGKGVSMGWLSRFLTRFFTRKKKGGKSVEKIEHVVQSGSRDVINESFRIVRGNIEFMNRTGGKHVIMVTSFNPGSGKSFVTYNLAASFAIKGKRVLVIDCDLRHGSASQYVGMPSKGLTNYLSGNTDDWDRLVCAVHDQPNMYVLPIGHRPPNPAEMLESPRVKTILEEAAEKYDYIFMDCPPVDVVVDTQILSPYADSTIFIVRAGLLDRAQISEIDEMYKKGRFHQMSILLNGTEGQFSKYGADGRGYYGNDYAVE